MCIHIHCVHTHILVISNVNFTFITDELRPLVNNFNASDPKIVFCFYEFKKIKQNDLIWTSYSRNQQC